MKKISFNLLVAILALSISGFENIHKSIVSKFLVQRVAGIYSQSINGNGVCTSVSTLPCKYEVTASGLANIPNQITYTPSNISSYLSAGYISPPPVNGNRIYVGE